MEITPSGLNPASVSPAGNTIDLSAIGLDEAMALGHSPKDWADAVRAWVFDLDCSTEERTNVYNTVEEELVRVGFSEEPKEVWGKWPDNGPWA